MKALAPARIVRNIATRRVRDKLDLTLEELKLVISVVEMVLDGSGCTFADWGESNPESLTVLESADHKLRVLNGEVVSHQANRVTMVSLILEAPGDEVLLQKAREPSVAYPRRDKAVPRGEW